MKIPFTDYHILAFLKSLANTNLPLDLSLQNYFKSHKSLGAKDRREIGNSVYGFYRIKGLLEFLSDDLREQLKIYKDQNFQIPKSVPKHLQLGLSKFLYKAIANDFGEKKTKEISRILSKPAPVTIRINPLKTSRDELLKRFQEKFTVTACNAPFGIQFAKREPLFSLPEFKEGLFEVQDEGSQLIAELVDARPGNLILDYCSGSGGKTLGFAHKMGGKGQIFLHDIRPTILTQAKKRLKRAGIQNAQYLTPDHPQLQNLIGKCHIVLIDVPCSGTGTLRRNPEQKWKIDAEMVERLKQEQQKIAEESVKFLHPKGKLIFATCSILKSENEEHVKFIEETLNLKLESAPLSLFFRKSRATTVFSQLFSKKIQTWYDQDPILTKDTHV